MNEKNTNRINTMIGKMQVKEMKQFANEKTLAKNLSATRQKLVNLQVLANDIETMKAQAIKHLNYCAKKRASSLMGYDVTSLKKEINNDVLQMCIDERGLNCVRVVSVLVGILDKKLKEMKRQTEKAGKKASK